MLFDYSTHLRKDLAKAFQCSPSGKICWLTNVSRIDGTYHPVMFYTRLGTATYFSCGKNTGMSSTP